MRLFDARLRRIADRQRKAHDGPVTVQVLYYHEENGVMVYEDALTGERVNDANIKPVADLTATMWEGLNDDTL